MGDPNPPTPEFNQSGYGWITGYLVVHVLSVPSRRYTYGLWVIIFLIFLAFTVLHSTGARHGFIGAKWTKWAIRRRTWRRFRSHPTALPSNGQLVSLTLLPLIAFIFCFVGPDYLPPSANILDFNGRAPPPDYSDPSTYAQFQPDYTIDKAWWTSGNRTGLIAFALFPLCILFALKAPPFAIFAIPFATQIHFDKLAWLHRWCGRLIWFITALHVGLWSVQLLLDTRPSTGFKAYSYAWNFSKFIWGWTAFGCFTLLIVLSFSFLRNPHYETFYFFHVALVVGTLVFSALHHPPVAIWCWIALGLWLAERVFRLVRWLHMNSIVPSPTVGEKRSSRILQYSDIRTDAFRYPPRSFALKSLLDPAMQYLDDRYHPPPGFVHAELVSGATVRLTFTPPTPITWAAGQHFLINVPSISRFTTHPFTIASVCDEKSSLRPLVFLIRSKNGWTQDLWYHVAALCHAGRILPENESPPPGFSPPPSGVVFRAYVDGPFGSCVRARWGSYSSALIVVGGSGVSFGVSILEYLCLCISGRDSKQLGSSRSEYFRTRRVRFVWIIREFAHLQWCASILRRCQDILPTSALQIDIFVTNFQRTDLPSVLPNVEPEYYSRKTSTPIGDAPPQLDPIEEMEPFADQVDLSLNALNFGDEDLREGDLERNHDYTVDLTDFDGDNDVALPGEDMLNRRVSRASTLRRARSRNAMKRLSISKGPLPPLPPIPMEAANLKEQDSTYGLSVHRSLKGLTPGKSLPYSPQDSAGKGGQDLSVSFAETPRPSPTQPISGQGERSIDEFISLSRPGTPDASPFSPHWSSIPTYNDNDPVPHPRLRVARSELQDVSVISEFARPGRPKLDNILAEESANSTGSVVVACCGPSSLNALVRKSIALTIDAERIRRGDDRGIISLVSEDFAY